MDAPLSFRLCSAANTSLGTPHGDVYLSGNDFLSRTADLSKLARPVSKVPNRKSPLARSTWRMILGFFYNRDFANAIKLLQFFGKGGDILRRDLAQEDNQIVGAPRVSTFH